MHENSDVKEFYKNKNIFITGATGFLGIALLEKLLRTCDTGTIYLLMRPKKGKEISERLQEIQKNLVFEKLKEVQGDKPFGKLVAVAGDIGEEGLGLSPRDRQTLIENVDVVFHSAATLDFEAGLRPTISINLLGTRRVVQLCSEMKNIKVLVHVSSAYVNSNRDSADEIIYDMSMFFEAEDLIKMLEIKSDEELDRITPQVLGDHPNTYTITKALAEHEVAKAAERFPTTIVRPSMIVAAWKEPVPGWTISKNGPQGFIMGAAKGVVRRLPVNKNLVYDYIPVDIVVNNLVVAGYHSATTRPKETPVFHCTSSTCRPFTWLQVDNRINEKLVEFPLKSAVWYPTMKLLPSLTMFKISGILFHFIPAFLLDMMLRFTGGRPILVKLHRNVYRSLGRLAPFIFREWFFDNSKTMALHKSLSHSDREAFNLDISNMDWVDFFSNLILGVRRYLHNEEMKTLSAAKKKNNILFIMNILVQVLFFTSIWYATSFISDKKMSSVVWIVPLVYALYSIL